METLWKVLQSKLFTDLQHIQQSINRGTGLHGSHRDIFCWYQHHRDCHSMQGKLVYLILTVLSIILNFQFKRSSEKKNREWLSILLQNMDLFPVPSAYQLSHKSGWICFSWFQVFYNTFIYYLFLREHFRSSLRIQEAPRLFRFELLGAWGAFENVCHGSQ